MKPSYMSKCETINTNKKNIQITDLWKIINIKKGQTVTNNNHWIKYSCGMFIINLAPPRLSHGFHSVYRENDRKTIGNAGQVLIGSGMRT